ncbi:hypothetical protein TNCT_640711 [Trichonephila clavata]|uniref:Uncharacterized protein n=1 Tax=Trichonephila clavata TaxID=2740835 RepID=A0A8X6IPG0_TRICU|nr:hypothetical protein TNCT_640711 [Trichonephila clavata]
MPYGGCHSYTVNSWTRRLQDTLTSASRSPDFSFGRALISLTVLSFPSTMGFVSQTLAIAQKVDCVYKKDTNSVVDIDRVYIVGIKS